MGLSCVSRGDEYGLGVGDKPAPVRFASAFALFFERELDRSGLTQLAVAERLGAGKSTVSGWATAAKSPQADNIERVFDLFGLDMEKGLRLLSVAARDVANGASAKAAKSELGRAAKRVPGSKQGFIRRPRDEDKPDD